MSQVLDAYYRAFRAVLNEAAAYVKADGDRRNRDLIFPTSGMRYHEDRFFFAVSKVNEFASRLYISEANAEWLFALLADTEMYAHRISKGPRKGQFEERTISSARIKSYRATARRHERMGVSVSLNKAEKIFRESAEYRQVIGG